jgi:hypothetical protein
MSFYDETAFCPLKDVSLFFNSDIVETGQKKATYPVKGKRKTVKSLAYWMSI